VVANPIGEDRFLEWSNLIRFYALVVRNAVDIFIEKEKKQKLTILKKVLGEEVYEKLLQLSNNYGKEIEATMIDLVELNCQPEAKQEEVIDDQWK